MRYRNGVYLLGLVSLNAWSAGNGLKSEYYDNNNFTALKTTRVDSVINLTAAPTNVGLTAATDFSVRWTGQIIAPATQTYTFYTMSDDGVRLWVDGKLIIDNWTRHTPTENRGTITLTAGKSYTIKMEYFQSGGGVVAQLSWSSPALAKQIIPTAQLYSGTTPAPTATPSPITTPKPTTAPAPTASPAPISNSSSGLHYTPAEVAIWKQRMNSGPFKNKSDAWTNSPGDWSRIKSNADAFITNPDADLWRPNATLGAVVPDVEGIKAKDAAFVYLLTGDKRYGDAVRNFLLRQLDIPHSDLGDWTDNANATQKSATIEGRVNGYLRETGWFESEWLTRMLFAYDYSKNLFTAAEKNKLNAYFKKSAWTMAYSIDGMLNQNFPNRLKGDYSVKGRDASGGAKDSDWAYYNSQGVGQHHVSLLAKHYNNRRASKIMAVGMVGFFLNDQELIKRAKIYVKEWITYSMFADGTVGEYERNGDYGNPQQGLIYNTINIQAAVMISDQFARRGDFELYEFITSGGMHGTEGGAKGLKMQIEMHFKLISGQIKRYYPSVNTCNLIDTASECSNRTHWVSELFFAPMANQYYKSQFVKDGYMRKAGFPQTPATGLGTAGPSGAPYGGVGGVFPGTLFMFGDLEGKVSVHPGR